MIKQTTFALVDETSGEVFVKDVSPDSSLTKTASFNNLDKPIKDFVDQLKPKKGKSYLLINAMGSSDYFGPNLNSDWFSEKVLEDHHKTFELYGHAYRHHINKDEKIADGKVLFSHFNKRMHRVELIVEVDDQKVRDILDRMKKGETVATSMAAKLSCDFCSICNNRATSTSTYCIHLKRFKNKIHTPSSPIPGAKYYGQKVYAINPDPKFFDISFVRIPADSTSSVILKVAEVFNEVGNKQAEINKESDIVKQVEMPLNAELIQATHGKMKKEDMKNLIEKYSMPEIMTHMVHMNMFPSRQDFQYMQMCSDGLHKEAEVLYDNNITFDCKGMEPDSLIEKVAENVNFNYSLASELAPYGPELGLGEPLVLARALTKQAAAVEGERDSVVNTVPYFLGVGGAYYAYNQMLDKLKKSKALQTVITTKTPPAAKHRGSIWLMRQHPVLFGAGLIGAGTLTNLAQRYLVNKQKTEDIENYMAKSAENVTNNLAEYVKKIGPKAGLGHFLTATGVVSPLVFLYSSVNRQKIKDGERVTHLGRFAAEHPYMLAAGGVGATYLPKMVYTQYKSPGNFAKAASIEDYYSYLYITDNEEFKKTFDNVFNS